MDVEWLTSPEHHDYGAAESYLSLVTYPWEAQETAAALRDAKESEHPAKDVLRASGLPLLPEDNAHVAKDLRKIKDGVKLSPVLLVRGPRALIIADGYHRICAAYHVDENAVVRARIV